MSDLLVILAFAAFTFFVAVIFTAAAEGLNVYEATNRVARGIIRFFTPR